MIGHGLCSLRTCLTGLVVVDFLVKLAYFQHDLIFPLVILPDIHCNQTRCYHVSSCALC